jgi:hypothetical protein
MEDDERSGHPRPHRTNENGERVWNLVQWDRRLSIKDMAVKLSLDKETVG